LLSLHSLGKKLQCKQASWSLHSWKYARMQASIMYLLPRNQSFQKLFVEFLQLKIAEFSAKYCQQCEKFIRGCNNYWQSYEFCFTSTVLPTRILLQTGEICLRCVSCCWLKGIRV
jgi:hypothetical protein